MRGASASTSGTRPTRSISSTWWSRRRKREILLRSFLSLRLVLTRFSLRLSGRNSRRVRLSLIVDSFLYKALLILGHVLLVNVTNLPTKK